MTLFNFTFGSTPIFSATRQRLVWTQQIQQSRPIWLKECHPPFFLTTSNRLRRPWTNQSGIGDWWILAGLVLTYSGLKIIHSQIK